MNRSVIMYPLARGADGDSGADLQTDVMRFMAILSLCLVAIFALVQSIPVAPRATAPAQSVPTPPAAGVDLERPAPRRPAPPSSAKTQAAPDATETLTRPAPRRTVTVPQASAAPAAGAEKSETGFTLRFESDLALTRLVAANRVAFFAIAPGRARRMAVSDSRLSFWDASMPASFHEMEASTVPGPVVDALARAGGEAASVKWGVTLPAALSSRLAGIMRERTGGALVIRGDGTLALDAP